jgi:hypothetical protein
LKDRYIFELSSNMRSRIGLDISLLCSRKGYLDLALTQTNLLHNITAHIFQKSFHIAFPSAFRSLKVSSHLRFTSGIIASISQLPLPHPPCLSPARTYKDQYKSDTPNCKAPCAQFCPKWHNQRLSSQTNSVA